LGVDAAGQPLGHRIKENCQRAHWKYSGLKLLLLPLLLLLLSSSSSSSQTFIKCEGHSLITYCSGLKEYFKIEDTMPE